MSLIELLLIAVGLSMDAFAVAVTNGLSYKKVNAPGIALAFGLFQGIMPMTGYFLGASFSKYIEKYDHWIAFTFLVFIGGKMIYETFEKKNELTENISFKLIIFQAVATSIDALAIGISFSVLNVNIFQSSAIIAATTFFIALIGVFIGKKFGNILNQGANIIGGLILIGIGLKILIEHLFYQGM